MIACCSPCEWIPACRCGYIVACQVHYDELYVPHGEGFVSRAATNLFLNHVCNPRLLPRSELDAADPAEEMQRPGMGDVL